MNAIVSGARSRSTVLTGAAGLLLVVAAVIMMVCAAPRPHQAQRGPLRGDRLASWVWVTRDHWTPAAPDTGTGSTPTRRALVP